MASGSCVLRKKSFLILKLLIEGNDTEEWGIASVSKTAQEEMRQGGERSRVAGGISRVKSDVGHARWEKIRKNDLWEEWFYVIKEST